MSTNKVALITGANRGIGLETAKQLGKAGTTILVGVRDEAKGTEAVALLQADGINARSLVVDLGDVSTFDPAVKEIESEFGKLDILVNNAGIMVDEWDGDAPAGASKTSDEVFRKTFDTNFFSTIALTQALLPLLKKSDAGRIVFLSSGLSSLTLHSDPTSPIYNFKVPAYDISKTALNGYAVHLAYELRDTPIKVNAAHPGSVVTDMNKSGDISVEEGAKTSVSLATLPEDGYSGKFIHLGQELPW